MNIEQSFDSSLRNSSTRDIGMEIAEIGIDSIFDNEILKQFPIVKFFAAVGHTGINLQDKLFLKKILAVLINIDDVTAEERNKIISEIDNSRKYRIKVGEKLLYVIEKCSDHDNSERIATLFKAVLSRKITYDEYLRTADIIAGLAKSDLDLFLKSYRLYSISPDAKELSHTGLIYTVTSEIEVDVDREDGGTRVSPVERYSASVSGGEITLHPTEAGNIVFEVFGIGKQELQKEMKLKSAERVRQMVENTKLMQARLNLKKDQDQLKK